MEKIDHLKKVNYGNGIRKMSDLNFDLDWFCVAENVFKKYYGVTLDEMKGCG